MDQAVHDHPGYFNLNEAASPGAYRVLDSDGYTKAVIANLEAAGFCVNRKTESIEIKNTNDFSEEYNIITSSGFIFRGSRSYDSTCTPANFPVDPADAIKFIFVGYFGTWCRNGATMPPWDEKILPLQCAGVITATPKDWSGLDVPLKIHGPDVEWSIPDGPDVVELDLETANEPFNRVIYPLKPGYFKVCATVLGKTGCMRGTVVP